MKLVVKMARDPAGGYRAWCPSLPGCVAFGRSAEECSRLMKKAVDEYLESLDVTVSKGYFPETPATGAA